MKIKFYLLAAIVVAASLAVFVSARAEKGRFRLAWAGQSALIENVRKGDLTSVQSFLGSGATPNLKDARDPESSTILMVAAMAGRTNVVSALVQAGAEVNAQNDKGRTALMFAAWQGESETVRTLIASGANVNAQDERGATALRYAISGRHADTTKILLDSGADWQLRGEGPNS